MPKLFIVGGRARANVKATEWNGFERAVVLSLDTETGKAETCISVTSPPEACPDNEPSILFKAGTFTGDRLWLCTQTEVMAYSVPDFRRTHYVSLPCFNDIHHVTPSVRGTILVAVTGLDMVIEMTDSGYVLREWDVMGDPLWARFSRDVDYRKIPTTKPHVAHPNFVFGLEDQIWTTRCDTLDAVCLEDMEKRIPVDIGYIHDGHVRGDLVYFTVVTGDIVIYDWKRGQVHARINLNVLTNTPDGRPLGWCRGIKILSDDRVLLGFTRVRETKTREKLIWIRERLGSLRGGTPTPWYPLPTRIACFDIKRGRLEWQIDLEPFGMNAAFSIHDSNEPDVLPA